MFHRWSRILKKKISETNSTKNKKRIIAKWKGDKDLVQTNFGWERVLRRLRDKLLRKTWSVMFCTVCSTVNDSSTLWQQPEPTVDWLCRLQDCLESSVCPAFSREASKSPPPSSCCVHTPILYHVWLCRLFCRTVSPARTTNISPQISEVDKTRSHCNWQKLQSRKVL